MATSVSTAKDLVNLHYTIFGKPPSLSQQTAYEAGLKAGTLDSVATTMLASTDAKALQETEGKANSPKVVATKLLGNLGIADADAISFVEKALDGTLNGTKYSLAQTAAYVADYVGDYKKGDNATPALDRELTAANSKLKAVEVPVAPTFKLTASAAQVTEGTDVMFTVTATSKVETDTTMLISAKGEAAGSSVSAAKADDISVGSGLVTIKAGEDKASFSVKTIADSTSNEGFEGFKVTLSQNKGTYADVVTSDLIVIADQYDTTAPVVTAAQTFSYVENQKDSDAVLGKVIATDALGVTGFAIKSGDTGGLFAISADGKITLTKAGLTSAGNDFETAPNSFALGVVAKDGAGNESAVTTVTLNVTDVDDVAPLFVNATAVGTNVRLNFGEALKAATLANPAATFTVTQGATSYTVTTAAISGSSVNLTLATALAATGDVKVGYAGTVLEDALGNKVATITDKVALADVTAPTLVASTPGDNAVAVAAGANVVLTFSEDVVLGTGNITIVNTADATDNRVIPVTDAGQVTVSGAVVTINPTADLKVGSAYAVNIGAAAVQDKAGNSYAGIADNTTLNFGVAAAAGVAGSTFTLTANADGPGALSPAVNTTGGASDDTYFGADGTLNSNDIIDAGAGANTLNFRTTATSGAAAVIPTLTNVQTINFTPLDATPSLQALNLASATGVTNVNFLNNTVAGALGTAGTLVSNIPAAATIGMNNADSGARFSFAGAATRTGTADAFNLTVSNGTGTVAAFAALDITTAAGAADATFETVNITTAGAGSTIDLNLGDTSYRVINVSGNATATATGQAGTTGAYALSISDSGGTAAAMRTVDASGLAGTGGLNIDLSGSTQTTVAFTGSAQNDRVLVDGGVINAVNTFNLNGGAGTFDILAVDAITDFNAAGQAIARTIINASTGFEALEATAAAVTLLNADDFATINSFVFSGALAGAALSNVTGLRTGDHLYYTVDSNGAASDAIVLTGAVAGQTVDLTLTGGVDITATADNPLTVNGGVTTLKIHSGNVGGAAAAAAVNTVVAATTVAAIDNTTLTNLVIDGTAGLTIGAVAGLADPVGFSAAISVDATGLSGVLRIAGSANSDLIVGGSGADIIYGRGGNDDLRGNAGIDQFRMVEAAANNGVDLIRDFTIGTDRIGIGQSLLSGTFNLAGSVGTAAGAAVAAADYIDGRSDISNIVAGDTLRIIELQSGLTAAQIAGQTSGAGAAVEALVLVFNTTTGRSELWYDDDWTSTATRSQLVTFDNITTIGQHQGFTQTSFVEFVV